MASQGLPHHGVLAHEDGGPSPEGHPDLLHLLGPDIVGVDDEALRVLVEQLNQFEEVICLPSRLVLPHHLELVVSREGFLEKREFKDQKARLSLL